MKKVVVGDLFAHYKILSQLGEGGMGEVFLAEDTQLGRKVAIKILHTSDNATGEIQKKRLQNEAKLLASLNHPNIVSVHNFGLHEGLNFIVMEYIDGLTLNHAIKKKMIGVGESVQIIKLVTQAIEEAHNNGILHRDIKPSNIIIDKKQNVKIVDFGISKSLLDTENNFTKTDCFIGTVTYTAPEILLGLSPSAASDIFSIGVVFYEMLTGLNPYLSTNQFESIEKIKSHKLTLPQGLTKLLPVQAQNIFKKMTTIKRELRYQTAAELLQDLQKIDTSEIPDILYSSFNSQNNISNRSTLESQLTKKGYQRSEVDIIINLAAKMETSQAELFDRTEEVDTSGDKPIDTNPQAKLTVSFTSLNLAMSRFEQTKTIQTQNKSIHTLNNPTNITRPIQQQSYFLSSLTVFLILGAGLTLLLTSFDSNSYISDVLPHFLSKQMTKIEKNLLMRQSPLASVQSVEAQLPSQGISLQYEITVVDQITGEYLERTIRTYYYSQVSDTKASVLFTDSNSSLQGQLTLLPNAFVPHTKYKDNRGTVQNVNISGDYNKIYPLTIGKKTTFSYKKITSGGKFVESTEHCKVVNQEQYRTANKSLQTLVIKCKGSNKTDTSIYYSPSIKAFVRKEVLNKGNGGAILTTYHLKNISYPKK